jgi:hypothetical protein
MLRNIDSSKIAHLSETVFWQKTENIETQLFSFFFKYLLVILIMNDEEEYVPNV